MPRKITPATSLDNLRKEAKRWLKALRAGDEEARARMAHAWPKGPAEPGLRDVQHALAREHGCDSWSALKVAVEQRAGDSSSPDATGAPESHAQLATRFLEYTCPDHHVRGRPAHRMARHAAMRMLEQHPEIARDSLYTAVVCGELDEVERLLRERPQLVNAKHASGGRDRSGAGRAMDFLQDMGTKAWEPLLYLCFTRLPLPKANDDAVVMARMLLDRGADPNAYFMAGDSRYTPLVGVIGEGEEDRPPHPHRDELARLLLERGAEPYDGQVIYNIHFHGRILWWTKLMYEFSVRAGRGADWNDPEWQMLDQGGYGSGARWHLWLAVRHNDLELAEWCLAHGASPDAGPPRAETLPQESLYEQAMRAGHVEMAELLARYGAERKDIVMDDGLTAADVARRRGMYQVAALLDTAAGNAVDAGSPAPFKADSAEECERLADDLVLAFDERDEAALQRLNAHYRRSFSFDDLWAEIWRRVYAFRQRAFRKQPQYLTRDEARSVIAQDAGFSCWGALTRAVATGAPPVPPYAIDTKDNSIAPRRQLREKEWDELIAVMKEHHITAIDANGLMTDSVLARIAALDHVTHLNLGGSRQLTDDGLRHLARMPQLEHLDLNEYPGGRLTDRGLEVLRHLPHLRTFEMTWQSGITDAGPANLRFCEWLERVNLMGSPTGDGTIEALQGKPRLRHFSSGRLVTDAGLPLLHNFPMLKTWRGGDVDTDPERALASAAHLLIDGPFTNNGLATLAGLDGVLELDLFWHVTGITSDAFVHLLALPNLFSLGADGALSDDVAMRYIAAMPRLRRLRCQGTVATDDGFEALSRSRTIEAIWGRECPKLGSRGFVALSKMPALRGLGVSCKNVDEAALSTLPRFPALRELTPIDVKDDGFRHIGRCDRLDRLTCMYCRDTTDSATEHIAALRLKYYYAGLTRITDRSLEVLGHMHSLEQVELYECGGVTDAGLVFLAGLPRLREVHLDGLPGVTLEGTRAFPAHVRVKYST